MLLDADEIHLWTATQSNFDLAELEAVCLPWLGQEDLRRYQRLQFSRHRAQMLLGRYLLRQVLSAYSVPTAPGDWQFVRNAHGKPALDLSCRECGLHFNLSHSQGRLVLALSRHEFTGVDVETTTRDRRVARIAARFFSPDEASDLLKLPAGLQLQRFYQLWTLKEAYIKARGLGLAIPLHEFSFQLEQGKPISVIFAEALEDESQAWHFWEIADDAAHRIALAVRPMTDCGALRVSKGEFVRGDLAIEAKMGAAPILAHSLGDAP